MISYEPFWKTLKSKDISTYTLIHKYHFSSSLISRLRKNQGISTNTINELCKVLKCKVEEIIKYVEID